MWEWHTKLGTADIVHARLFAEGRAASCGEMIRAWQSDPAFRTAWISLLRDIPFESYCLELPPLTRQSLSQPAECVFVLSSALSAVVPDAGAFEKHFTGLAVSTEVVCFENLGRDAFLVVPCPIVADDAYTHLAVFARHAPEHQVSELWRKVGETLMPRIGDVPVWLSTAGLGVYWLHVRIDARPKYFRYRPYASAAYIPGN